MACGALVGFDRSVINVIGSFVLGWLVQNLEPRRD